MAKTPKKKTIFRSSKTGKLVTEAYAKRNPATTEKERARCFRSLDFIGGAEKDAAMAELALGGLK